MTMASPPSLQPHQYQELKFLQEHPRSLLLSETGTGKTVTAISRVLHILDSGGSVCWITNKSLQSQLVSESSKWLPAEFQPAQYLKAEADRPFIYLTHQLAQRRASELRQRGPFDLLVVDEAAEVGGGGANAKHKTYQAIKELTAQARASILMSAEPLGTVHALDLWAVADCGALPGLPSRQVMNGWVQWQEHLTPRGRAVHTPAGITHDGFLNLLRAIRPHQMRTRIDSVTNLVPLTVVQHPVTLSNDAQASYDAVHGIRGLEGHHARQQASRDASALVPEVIDLLIRTYAEHESVVVFIEMFDLVNPLAQAFRDRRITFHQVHGSVPERQRRALIESHQRGGVRVLLITSAAEKGINAQRSTLLISVVQSYSPSRERQREGRIRRLGSTSPRLVHAIVRPEVGHEARRDEILDAKERLIAAMWAGLE